MKRPDSDLDDLDDSDESGQWTAEELLEYEEQRARRRVRRNAVSGRITVGIMIFALGLWTYDSGGAALRDHDAGRSWAAHAISAGVSLVAILLVVGWVVRRAKRRRRQN